MISDLLNVKEEYREYLHMVLYKYHGIFLGTLLTQAPLSWKLGDIHEIPLMESDAPIRKSMYKNSP